ncbi:glucosaminidase domain-containing protein [Daejeonella lutea]|uniref:Mannosyl-glycoprotein endo-beta-N-acetylglucosaminidase n=1 Tax=Daejeonella lutea TaxID=572036 RepID=A0A1T5BUY2_9SPHI|nr:glucosaminidase domain-containing protein [Daejeonella lutea]SKB51015.1 Mannosyl-glycoprotein endo-beta-N-acetylglucosaminidase [Daejeonella lutea]
MIKKKSLKSYLFYGLLIFMGYGAGHFYFPTKDTNPAEAYVAVDTTDTEEFSAEALLAYMKKLKIKYPETVLAQAILETGNFTSDIFKENHNLFGMKVAGSRPTSAIGTNRNHAQYRNWKESVVDYALFQSFIIAKLPSNNKQEYRTYIQKFYSTTSDYLVRIDRAINSNAIFGSENTQKNMITSQASMNPFDIFSTISAIPGLVTGGGIAASTLKR